jgi:chromosome partitioning protein
LATLDIPLVATLRDTQNYVRSAEAGIGIHEMPRWQVDRDLEQWAQLTGWLASRKQPASAQEAKALVGPGSGLPGAERPS